MKTYLFQFLSFVIDLPSLIITNSKSRLSLLVQHLVSFILKRLRLELKSSSCPLPLVVISDFYACMESNCNRNPYTYTPIQRSPVWVFCLIQLTMGKINYKWWNEKSTHVIVSLISLIIWLILTFNFIKYLTHQLLKLSPH